MKKNNFFSILIDGSTDSGNVDNELILVVWFDANGSNEIVHTYIDYFKICRPTSVSAEGLYEMLEEPLQVFGIEEINESSCCKLVGVGTDGASANVASNGHGYTGCGV